MKCFSIAALLIVLLTGNSAQAAPDEKELEAKSALAAKKFTQCGKRAVAILDDGISDATIVARVMGNYCGSYAENFADTESAVADFQGKDFDRDYFYDLLVNKSFTDIVLMHRVAKSKSRRN